MNEYTSNNLQSDEEPSMRRTKSMNAIGNRQKPSHHR